MNEAIIGVGGWVLSYSIRRIVAKSTFSKNTNAIVKNPGRSNREFARKLLAREATQDLIKDTIPMALGVLGILVGVYEVALGNTEFGMSSIFFGMPHLLEDLIYKKNRKKEIDKNTQDQ